MNVDPDANVRSTRYREAESEPAGPERSRGLPQEMVKTLNI